MVYRVREYLNDDPFAIVAHFTAAQLRIRQTACQRLAPNAKEHPLDIEHRNQMRLEFLPEHSIAVIALVRQA